MASFARQVRLYIGLLLLTGVSGCASPGLPKQPSLGLPALVTDLTASREGDIVALHFTEPTRATDKLPLKGPITVVLCRQESAGSCNSVQRRTIPAARRRDEVVTLDDPLPSSLTARPPTLLTYRVTLYNEKNRAFEASNPAYAAAGAAPEAPSNFTAAAGQGGAVLRWRNERGTDVIDLERKDLSPPAPKPARTTPGEKMPNPLQQPAVSAEALLHAGDTDAGGTVDPGAQFGRSYSYIAWRVRRLTLVGHAVELRSAPSAAVTVEMRDVFAPAVPRGLTAVPAGSGPSGSGIDLSWEPDTELDLAGYVIYRAGAGSAAEPVRLNPAPTEVPAFHDATAVFGRRYRYSVSAIDETGNESRRSAEVEEGIE